MLSVSVASATSRLPDEIIIATDNSQNTNRAQAISPLAKELAARLGTKLVRYPCPWARCLKAVEQGKIDLIFSVFKTTEREKSMLFLQPALAQHQVTFYFLVKDLNKTPIRQYSDLAQLSIATLRGNQYFSRFDQDDTLNKFASVSYQSAINLAINNRVDTVIDLSLTPKQQKASADPQQQLTPSPYQPKKLIEEYIALSKASKWQSHQSEVEQALTEMVNDGIIKKYMAQVTD